MRRPPSFLDRWPADKVLRWGRSCPSWPRAGRNRVPVGLRRDLPAGRPSRGLAWPARRGTARSEPAAQRARAEENSAYGFVSVIDGSLIGDRLQWSVEAMVGNAASIHP